MRTWLAILFTFALLIAQRVFVFAAAMVVAIASGATTAERIQPAVRLIDLGSTFVLIAGTAVWAAVDSKRLQMHKYKSGIGLKPAGIFLGVLLLWIIGFPWYLSARYKVRHNLMPLKPEFEVARSA